MVPLGTTMTFCSCTWRAYCVVQLPHDDTACRSPARRSCLMIIVPGPLCWKTLSDAFCAPPPSIVIIWRGRRALQRRRVLADVLPPDVLQRAGAVAVDAVGGRISQDDVLQASRRSATWNSGPWFSLWPLVPSAAGADEAAHGAVVDAGDRLRRGQHHGAGGRRPGARHAGAGRAGAFRSLPAVAGRAAAPGGAAAAAASRVAPPCPPSAALPAGARAAAGARRFRSSPPRLAAGRPPFPVSPPAPVSPSPSRRRSRRQSGTDGHQRRAIRDVAASLRTQCQRRRAAGSACVRRRAGPDSA